MAPLAASAGAALTQWSTNLTDGTAAATHLRGSLGDISPNRFATATLINNAGAIPAIVPLRDSRPADLANALRIRGWKRPCC